MNDDDNRRPDSPVHVNSKTLFIKNSLLLSVQDLEEMLATEGLFGTIYKHPVYRWITITATSHDEALRMWTALNGKILPYFANHSFAEKHVGCYMWVSWRRMKVTKKKQQQQQQSTLAKEEERDEEKDKYDQEYPPLFV